MAELNPIRLTRKQLARICGDDHALIKAFEALFDVTGSSSDDIETLTIAVGTAQDGADSAQFAALTAAALAQTALNIAAAGTDGPPPLVAQLVEQVDDPTHRLTTMEAQLHAMASRIAALEDRPSP